MDASTSMQGLATSKVASCLAIVIHSPTTGRTVLSHSPNFLQMNTFVPIVDWVTGGKGEVSWEEMPAWFEGAGAKPCDLETIILRGFLYATLQAVRFGHANWMGDFKQFFSMFSPYRAIRLNIVGVPKFLVGSAILVDKTTARITCLELPAKKQPGNDHIVVQNTDISPEDSYSKAQTARDLFVGMLLLYKTPRQPTPITLQYDVSRYCLPIPLPDEGRLLLRSKKEGEPSSQQSAIIRAAGTSEDWITDPGGHSTINDTLRNCTILGPPCELCEKSGLRKCGGCKGAWYCGEVHQRENWKAHKGWCKSHPISK